MAAFMKLAVLLGVLVSPASPMETPTPPGNQNLDLVSAIDEMKRANYFTFVTLINMASLGRKIQENVTFLMPNDRMLSRTVMPQGTVFEFLLRHSIPSPLLFDYLEHIPTGSIIPSSFPGYMLRIINNGRRNFSINNVKIISPNICMEGSSIRCHGIDGVLLPTKMQENNTTISPFASCSSSSPPAAVGRPSAPSFPSPTVPLGVLNPTAASAPRPSQPNASPQRSGPSPWFSYGGMLKFLVSYMMVLIVASI